jgi:serine/threonine-protein kinase
MPTEQGRGQPQPNSDLYALGMIAIQALTLKTPTQLLDESENGEIVWQHLATVSEALAAVLTKMVRYNHRNRYQSAAEALAALKQMRNLEFGIRNLGIKAGLQEYSIIKRMAQKNPPLQARNSSRPPVSSLHNSSHYSLPPKASPAAENSSVQASIPVNRRSDWQVGAAITAALATIIGISTIDWPLANTEKRLEQITTLKAQGKEQCAVRTTTSQLAALTNTNSRTLLYECQLAQAKKLAAARNFPAAIAEASKIPPTNAFFNTAKQLIAQWSNSLLELATKQYQSGQKKQAIASAKAVPFTSSVYSEAQKAIEQWQESDKNHAIAHPSQRATRQVAQPAAKRVTRPVAQTQVRTTPVKTTRSVAKTTRTAARKSSRTTPKRLPTSLTKRPPVRTTTRKTSASVAKRSNRIIYRRVTHSITQRTIRQSHRRITRSVRQRKTDNFAQTKRKIENIKRSYRWIEKTIL